MRVFFYTILHKKRLQSSVRKSSAITLIYYMLCFFTLGYTISAKLADCCTYGPQRKELAQEFISSFANTVRERGEQKKV